MRYDLSISIRGIKVNITTDYPRYYDYLKNHFNRIICKNALKPDIIVEAFWGRDNPRVVLSEKAISIGANTILSDRQIQTVRKIARKKKVRFKFSLDEKILKVEAVSQFKPFKDTIRYSLFRMSLDNYFFEFTYPLVYYPVFWYLEYFNNTHVLHASSVKIKDSGLVIVGMEGVGKTTLSLLLVRDNHGMFLSDNLTFYDENKIYACYEPVRLHKTQDPSLWNSNFRKINDFRTMKDFYEPINDVYDEAVAPGIFMTVGFSKSFFIKQVPAETILKLSLNFSNLVQELNNYNEYASFLNLLVDDSEIMTSRHKALAALLKKVKCYEVGLDKSLGPSGNFEKMKGTLLK